MLTRYLFVGPTLPDAAELTEASGIVVLPPVSAGDLLALRASPGDVVGIVDGYFHQTRAIPHKEILDLLSRGVRVLGAASLGALRGAELAAFGMVGVGGIFTDYRDGRLWADDEVALLHGLAADGYASLSEPLVNIRATLAGAVDAGLCGVLESDAVVRSYARMPYRDRTWHRLPELLAECGVSTKDTDRLVEHCGVHRVNRKRADALELIAELSGESRPVTAGVDVPRTVHLRNWQAAADSQSDSQAMALCQVLAPEYPRLHRDTVLDWLATQCRRDCGTQDSESPAEVVAVRHGVHRGLYADHSADLGFVDAWTTPAERRTHKATELLVLFLVRSFRIRPGIVFTDLALRTFRRHRVRDHARAMVDRVAKVNEAAQSHRADFDPAAIAADQVVSWLSRRWGRSPEELELAAFDRGFSSLGGAIVAARPYYLAAQCDQVVGCFTLDDQ